MATIARCWNVLNFSADCACHFLIGIISEKRRRKPHCKRMVLDLLFAILSLIFFFCDLSSNSSRDGCFSPSRASLFLMHDSRLTHSLTLTPYSSSRSLIDRPSPARARRLIAGLRSWVQTELGSLPGTGLQTVSQSVMRTPSTH